MPSIFAWSGIAKKPKRLAPSAPHHPRINKDNTWCCPCLVVLLTNGSPDQLAWPSTQPTTQSSMLASIQPSTLVPASYDKFSSLRSRERD